MDDTLGEAFVPDAPHNGDKVVLVLDSDDLTIANFGTFCHEGAEETVRDLRYSEMLQEWQDDDPHGYFIAAVDEDLAEALESMSRKQRIQVIQAVLGIHIGESRHWKRVDA